MSFLKSHLEILIRALRDYIIEQKKEILKKAIDQLKRMLDFDSTAIDHLHLALYSFQDAVIAVLRSHSIKPHWMFALDNLVKTSVHAGLMILSPELGANLAGHDRPDDVEVDEDEGDELSTSGVSTVNSTKLKHSLSKDLTEESGKLMEQVKILKRENTKLLNELVESQKTYQSLLKSQASDQSLFSDVLKGFMSQLSGFTRNYDRSSSFGYFSDRSAELPTPSPGAVIDETDSKTSSPGKKINIALPPIFKNPQLKSPLRQCHDQKLTEWLHKFGFDDESRVLISNADFFFEDFIYESDKDDIRRIGLR